MVRPGRSAPSQLLTRHRDKDSHPLQSVCGALAIYACHRDHLRWHCRSSERTALDIYRKLLRTTTNQYQLRTRLISLLLLHLVSEQLVCFDQIVVSLGRVEACYLNDIASFPIDRLVALIFCELVEACLVYLYGPRRQGLVESI